MTGALESRTSALSMALPTRQQRSNQLHGIARQRTKQPPHNSARTHACGPVHKLDKVDSFKGLDCGRDHILTTPTEKVPAKAPVIASVQVCAEGSHGPNLQIPPNPPGLLDLQILYVHQAHIPKGWRLQRHSTDRDIATLVNHLLTSGGYAHPWEG